MIWAEYRLKAKVVVEQTKGMPSFKAMAFPQTAIESATIQSGLSCAMCLHTTSPNASVVSARIRMEKAKGLLETSNMKSYEVALAVGYNDPHYFSTAFKKIMGQSPKEFRNNISQEREEK